MAKRDLLGFGDGSGFEPINPLEQHVIEADVSVASDLTGLELHYVLDPLPNFHGSRVGKPHSFAQVASVLIPTT